MSVIPVRSWRTGAARTSRSAADRIVIGIGRAMTQVTNLPQKPLPSCRAARRSSQARARQDAIAGALEAVGWVQQVLVNRRSGFVVDGHARVALALARCEAGGAWQSHPQRWAMQSRNAASLTSPLAMPRITWSVSSGSPGAGIQVRPLRSTNSTVPGRRSACCHLAAGGS